MRNPERIDEILKCISIIWHKYPDLRLCQLIGNCFPEQIDGDGDSFRDVDLYYLEDDVLQDKLINWYGSKEDK